MFPSCEKDFGAATALLREAEHPDSPLPGGEEAGCHGLSCSSADKKWLRFTTGSAVGFDVPSGQLSGLSSWQRESTLFFFTSSKSHMLSCLNLLD